MSRVRPLACHRPAPALVAEVSSPPYDVVSKEQVLAILEKQPQSFLGVLRPDAVLASAASAEEQHAEARRRLELLIQSGALVADPSPTFYLYRLAQGEQEQTGLVALCSPAEYDAGSIKKHEHVRPAKVIDRQDHFKTVGAQTGPIFLAHRSDASVATAMSAAWTAASELYDFTDASGVRHSIRRVSEADVEGLSAAFEGLDALYIADGHHRTASACGLHEGGDEGGVLAVIFAEDCLNILAYNRLVKELGEGGVAGLRGRLMERFGCLESPEPSPSRPGLVSLYGAGEWSTHDLSTAWTEGPVGRFDTQALQSAVFSAMLGIDDPRTDARLGFVGGNRGPEGLAEDVDGGKALAAFSLYPVAMSAVMDVSDAGDVLPPKSTWFEPKLRSGLFVHDLEGRLAASSQP